MSRESLTSDIWRACDIMRRDDGTTGVMEYMEQLSWLLFLKAFEGIESLYFTTSPRHDYKPAIVGPYCWSVWTSTKRKRKEAKLAESRQEMNKAKLLLERAEQRLAATKLPREGNTKNGNTATKKDDQQGLAEAELLTCQEALEQAKVRFQQAERELSETISWLEDQVRVLYDEQVIEQQVLHTINQQFGGQLILAKEQLDSLRENERNKGIELARKLVEGLTGSDLVSFVDNHLFPYLRRLHGPPEKQIISNIFSEISGNRMRSAENLQAVINILDRIDFHNQEDTQIVSQVYEGLLSRLGTESGIAGEFYTPRPIVRFMVEAIDPRIGETIYDPFCGSAGFLVEAYKYMAMQEQTPEDHLLLQRSSLYGQEKKPLPTLLGVMNMMLHGVLAPNIRRVNTLEKNIRKITSAEQYNIILTNPPFGGMEGVRIQENFPTKNNATELLSLQHIVASLSPNGRCGVVIPEGFLSRTDDAFSTVKQMLLEKFNLYAIISLPAGVFANASSAGSGPKTDVLFFERSGPTKQIWYYMVNQVGYTLTKAQRPIPESDLPQALVALRQYRQAVLRKESIALDEFSWVVSVDEIRERNYDLSVRNPNQIIEDYSHQSPDVLINDLLAKHQRLGEILVDLQEWLGDERLPGSF